jgi:hypothetical protein
MTIAQTYQDYTLWKNVWCSLFDLATHPDINEWLWNKSYTIIRKIFQGHIVNIDEYVQQKVKIAKIIIDF